LIEELDAEERTLTREDLNRAERLMICNALRGAVPARLKLLS
jgi:para-aminobenzoate synthetase/4-amino-4-deoxychorismate lyase